MDTTLDGFLNKRVMVEQPATGYRAAVDTVLLAAAVPARAGQRVAEFGCGVGTAMLCLATRVKDVKILGLEVQQELLDICQKNILRNNFQESMQGIKSDVSDLPKTMQGQFDAVMMNPPYHQKDSHSVSPIASKAIANSAEDDLPLWIKNAAQVLNDGGTLTIIHRADRMQEIVDLARAYFAHLIILPIVSKTDQALTRIIMQAHKKGAGATKILNPLIMHQENGTYSDGAESILRHAQGLDECFKG